MRGLALTIVVATTTLVLATAGAARSVAVQPSFHLVFDGKHNENLWHEGPFTSSADYCPSGYAVDVDVDDTTLTALRRFSCSNGGDFTARLASLRSEHGGSGSWTIIGGSGPLADLRGKGTFTSVRLSGDPNNPASITFRSTWDGFAAFDIQPPTIGITSATLRRLPRPSRTWRLLVQIAANDAGGTTSWRLVVSDRRSPQLPLASRSGRANGSTALTLQLRAPKGARALRLQLEGTDLVGNQATSARVVRLP